MVKENASIIVWIELLPRFTITDFKDCSKFASFDVDAVRSEDNWVAILED